MSLILLILTAYCFGSIPFGLLIGRIKGINLREKGSGNIGAANAMRTLGFGFGLLVLLCDILKSAAALSLAVNVLGKSAPPIDFVFIGLAAIIGHNYSIFLKFGGGKGVAATLGVFLFLSWQATMAALVVWLIVVAVTRFASLGSLAASLILPFSMVFFHVPTVYIEFAALAAILIFYKHRGNIGRLLRGEENRLTR